MTFDFAATYDELNPARHDYHHYAALAQETGATRVLDLGCGTGVLALLLAGAGCRVVAIDPDPDMLRVARESTGADGVDWRLGRSDRADTASVDLAVMSGHVAQVFVEDRDWEVALRDLRRALVPGGTLAFETRDPLARGWETWTRSGTLREVDTDEGTVEFWHETVAVDLPRVTYDTFTRNLDTGAESTTRAVLAFRTLEAVRASLDAAGFDVVAEYGDWSRVPVTPRSPELIVHATARRLS